MTALKQTEEQRAILCYWKMREEIEKLYEESYNNKYWPYMIIVPPDLMLRLSHHPDAIHHSDQSMRIYSFHFTSYLTASVYYEGSKKEITIFWDCDLEYDNSMDHLEYRDEAW